MLSGSESDAPDHDLLAACDSPIVRTLLGTLEPRERQILELRFGLDGYEGPPRTFKEIGKIVGLTRERVRQLEKKALASLQEAAEKLV